MPKQMKSNARTFSTILYARTLRTKIFCSFAKILRIHGGNSDFQIEPTDIAIKILDARYMGRTKVISYWALYFAIE